MCHEVEKIILICDFGVFLVLAVKEGFNEDNINEEWVKQEVRAPYRIMKKEKTHFHKKSTFCEISMQLD